MNQLSFWSVEHPVNHSHLLDCEKDLTIQEETLRLSFVEFLTTLNPNGLFGKMSQVSYHQIEDGTLEASLGRWQNSGMGFHTEFLTLNTLESPKDAKECLLSDTLEVGNLAPKYYLSPIACQGILRRAKERNKTLPTLLYQALQTVCKQLATNGAEQTDLI